MQILIGKSGRRVKLTKRENDLLSDAKTFLAELASVGGADIAANSDRAAEEIGRAQEAIANQGKEVAAPY